MSKNITKTIIICIIVIILSFLIMYCYIKYKTYKINKEAKEIVDKFIDSTKDEIEEDQEKDNQDGNDNKDNKEKHTNKIYYNNNLVIGTIEIPKIKISYPIVEDITEESMKRNIVILYGSLNNTGNTVLAGHAYIIGTYFSNIYDLKNGDEIIITDISGKRITYYVYDKFKADKNDSSFYKRETNNLREITLSTCTPKNDNKRNIVLAREKKKN